MKKRPRSPLSRSRRKQRKFRSAVESVVTRLFAMEQAEKPRTRLRNIIAARRQRFVEIRDSRLKRQTERDRNASVRAEWLKTKPEIVGA